MDVNVNIIPYIFRISHITLFLRLLYFINASNIDQDTDSRRANL